ncbi:MAG: sodium:solute symporter family protein [Acidimicrobiia bacterium]|nr:sodium:solute symporter family protein [Acidimicrobiia bacterium]
MLGLTPLDVLVLLSYFLVVVGIGWASAHLVKTNEDFLMGGRRFGKLLTAFFAFGAGTHADNAVGVASKSYSVGLSGIWYQWVMLFTLPIYWLLAPIFRRARVQTTADFFELRYGTNFMLLYTVFGMAVCIIFTAVMLFGSAQLIESLTGGAIPAWSAVFLIAAVSFLYGIMGGLIAAVWNDFFQGLLTIVMSLLILPFFWIKIGGLNGFQAALPDPEKALRLVMDEEITIYWIVMMSINSLLSMVVQPHIMTNVGSAKTETDSRVGFIGGLLMKRLITVPWALTGVMAIALYGPGTIKADHAFGLMARDLLPAGFAGLMVACIMASVMDNVAVFMICFAGFWTNSIHKRFLRPALEERETLRINRISSLAFGACSVGLAFAFGDMPSAMRFTFNTVPLMGIAFFLGLYWRRGNRYGAFASFFAALAAMLVAQGVFRWTGDAGLPLTITFFLTAGCISGVLVSCLTPPEPAERLNQFFLRINTPIGQEARLLEPALIGAPASGNQALASERNLSVAVLDAETTVGGSQRKLLPFKDWEIPVPSREAWIGSLVCAGIVLLLLAGVLVLASWLAPG